MITHQQANEIFVRWQIPCDNGHLMNQPETQEHPIIVLSECSMHPTDAELGQLQELASRLAQRALCRSAWNTFTVCRFRDGWFYRRKNWSAHDWMPKGTPFSLSELVELLSGDRVRVSS